MPRQKLFVERFGEHIHAQIAIVECHFSMDRARHGHASGGKHLAAELFG